MWETVCRMGLEGVMLKRPDAPYVAGRSDAWLKLKCHEQQDFAIVGFTTRGRTKDQVGSLFLGYYQGGRYHYAGTVGTGWSLLLARQLYALLASLETGTPVVNPALIHRGTRSRSRDGDERWVQPKLIVEVAFAGWTQRGVIRLASFRRVSAKSRAKP
jgi:bifunctional non-homologous end joining protein LigD